MNSKIALLLLLVPMMTGCESYKKLIGDRDSDPVVTPPPAPTRTLLAAQDATVQDDETIPDNVHYTFTFPELIGLDEADVEIEVFYKETTASDYTLATVQVYSLTIATGEVTVSTGPAFDAISGFDGDVDFRVKVYQLP